MGNVYIFVHGLSGWGSYDAACRRMPYWGMRGGDLMEYLRGRGFDCHAASVAPEGPAWSPGCGTCIPSSGGTTCGSRAASCTGTTCGGSMWIC